MSPDPVPPSHPHAAVLMDGVSVVRDGRVVVEGVDWEVGPASRWVLLGANGSGKTSLVRIAALYDHPSSGTLDVLGQRLGRCDVRALRRRIGYVSPGFVDMIRPELVVSDVVMCAINAALEPWWHRYDDDDRRRAHDSLDRLGIGWLADRRFGTLSSGERQRVQLARALMCRPELLLLDEPTAGLDLAGREEFVGDLDALATSPGAPAMVLVTHHVEEIPTSFEHALLLGERGEATSRVVASGPIDDALTSGSLSRCFGLGLEVERRGGRWTARAVD